MQKRGSLTVFTALSFMLIIAVLFTLLEAARTRTITYFADMNTNSIMESIFATYQLPMWEQYHLLGFDATGAEGCFSLINQEALGEELAQCNLNPKEGYLSAESWNLYRMELVDLSFLDYVLITDDNGAAYESLVASYMMQNLPVEAAEKIYNQYQSIQVLNESSEDTLKQIGEAKEVLEQLRESEDKVDHSEKLSAEETKGDSEKNVVDESYNPIDEAEKLQDAGILSLVVENPEDISNRQIDCSQVVSKRNLEKGTGHLQAEENWYDQVLMDFYFTNYFVDYQSASNENSLSYEIEYLTMGQASDVENLRNVANLLLGIREVSNMLFLLSDAAKNEEALALATVIAGATVNPAIIEIVKYGILASWAFVESILDVRALLQGDKIALVKNSEQWTTDLYGLSSSVTSFGKAKECSNGISYSQYLLFLLLLQNKTTVAYRAMDLQECRIRQMEGYETFRMDHLVIAANTQLIYSWNTLFFGFVNLGDVKNQQFTYNSKGTYSFCSVKK